MRSLLALVATLLMLVACRPASMPDHTSAAEDVNSKTVALVRDDPMHEPRTFCSGVWIAAHEILTAKHCIDDEDMQLVQYASFGDVEIPDPKTVTARLRPLHLIKASEDRDLALLYADSIPPHGVADLSRKEIRAGMFAQAAGHPLGFWWTYTSGEVSGDRYVDFGEARGRWVFASVPIGPGNSGGGLFDADGDLLGICHGGARNAQNLNVWVHRDELRKFLGR